MVAEVVGSDVLVSFAENVADRVGRPVFDGVRVGSLVWVSVTR